MATTRVAAAGCVPNQPLEHERESHNSNFIHFPFSSSFDSKSKLGAGIGWNWSIQVRGLHDAGLTTSGDCSRVSAESFGHLGWNVMLNKQDGARICVGRE